MKYKVELVPCTCTKEDLSEQIDKINEELHEFTKEHYTNERYAMLRKLGYCNGDPTISAQLEARSRLVEEGVDILTAVATYFAKAGITEAEVRNAGIMVEAKNRKRGYSL